MPFSLFSGRCFSAIFFLSCQILLFQETFSTQCAPSIVPTGSYVSCYGAFSQYLDIINDGFSGNLICHHQNGVKRLTATWQFDYEIENHLILYYNCTMNNGSTIIRLFRICIFTNNPGIITTSQIHEEGLADAVTCSAFGCLNGHKFFYNKSCEFGEESNETSSLLISPTPSYYSPSPSSSILSMYSPSSLASAGISSIFIINSISPTQSAASHYPYSNSFVSSNEIPLETSLAPSGNPTDNSTGPLSSHILISVSIAVVLVFILVITCLIVFVILLSRKRSKGESQYPQRSSMYKTDFEPKDDEKGQNDDQKIKRDHLYIGIQRSRTDSEDDSVFDGNITILDVSQPDITRVRNEGRTNDGLSLADRSGIERGKRAIKREKRQKIMAAASTSSSDETTNGYIHNYPMAPGIGYIRTNGRPMINSSGYISNTSTTTNGYIPNGSTTTGYISNNSGSVLNGSSAGYIRNTTGYLPNETGYVSNASSGGAADSVLAGSTTCSVDFSDDEDNFVAHSTVRNATGYLRNPHPLELNMYPLNTAPAVMDPLGTYESNLSIYEKEFTTISSNGYLPNAPITVEDNGYLPNAPITVEDNGYLPNAPITEGPSSVSDGYLPDTYSNLLPPAHIRASIEYSSNSPHKVSKTIECNGYLPDTSLPLAPENNGRLSPPLHDGYLPDVTNVVYPPYSSKPEKVNNDDLDSYSYDIEDFDDIEV